MRQPNAQPNQDQSGVRLEQIEDHHGDSPGGLTDLERSRRLSSILGEYTLPDTFSDPETFRARVMLRVPRRKAVPPRRASWAWYAVPASLICFLLISQGLLALAGALGLITSTVWWSDAEILMPARSWLSEWISGSAALEALGPSLPILLYVGLQAAAALALIVVFLPYVGWVTVLWRTETRPVALKGEQNGTL